MVDSVLQSLECVAKVPAVVATIQNKSTAIPVHGTSSKKYRGTEVYIGSGTGFLNQDYPVCWPDSDIDFMTWLEKDINFFASVDMFRYP